MSIIKNITLKIEKLFKRDIQHILKKRYNKSEYKMEVCLRNRIRKILKGFIKHGSTIDLLGCDRYFFLIWIEYQFNSEMTFENHGTVWHIDHVIPCAKFNNLDKDDQKRCFNWTNCQPLKSLTNLKKKSIACLNEIANHKNKIEKFIEEYGVENYTDYFTNQEK